MSQKENLSQSDANSQTENKQIDTIEALNDSQIEIPQPVKFTREWFNLSHTEGMIPNFSIEHPFSITLGLQYSAFTLYQDDHSIARLFLGIRGLEEEYRSKTELGLHMGRLFINDVLNSKPLSKQKLVDGIQLILTVTPLEHGRCLTILKAVDEFGLTLSSISTRKFLSINFKGGIFPSIYFNYMLIEGSHVPYFGT